MAQNKKKPPLIPPIFIVLMVAALILPIGAFFGMYMQKRSKEQSLVKKREDKQAEFNKILDIIRSSPEIKKKKEKLGKAESELTKRLCKTKEEAEQMFNNFREVKSSYKIYTFKKEFCNINNEDFRFKPNIKGFDEEAVFFFTTNCTDSQQVFDLFMNITKIGYPIYRCMTSDCAKYFDPIDPSTGLTNCESCKQLLKYSLMPKYYYFEEISFEKYPSTNQLQIRITFPIQKDK